MKSDHNPIYVVVITRDGNVTSVVGPQEGRIEAQALADVIRKENGVESHVRRVREAMAFDVHGQALTDELWKLFA